MTAMQKLLFLLEAKLVKTLLALLRLLPPVAASRMIGSIAATLGPLLPVTRVADRNLQLALPDLTQDARRDLIRSIWRSLGNTAGEYPHLAQLQETASGPGWEVDPASRAILLEQQARGGPAIFFSGHLGNWEMLPAIVAAHGILMSSAYRPPANPFIDQLLMTLRHAPMGSPVPMFPKGRAGAKAAMGHLGKGGYLGLLIDQKMNDGIEATLFGRPAMTAPALAALALRYRCPVIPGHIVRLGPARLKLVVEKPLQLPDSGDRHADIAALTQTVNDYLERWIKSAPADWLWLHRRWPKSVYKKPA